MKKSVWLNYFLICLFLSLFTACGDSNDDDEGTNDDGNISDKEIVVTMIVKNVYSGRLEVGFEISGYDWYEYGYVSQFLQDYKSIPFPKDLVVNWGDGTETNSTTHEYAPGTYQITLKCRELQILRIKGYGFTVKEMDLSQALDLGYLGFAEISISKPVDLRYNKKLKFLGIGKMAEAPLMDVSKNTALMCLDFDWIIGKVGDLDFSKNKELRYLNLSDCSNYNGNGVTSLNIKGCNELVYLRVDEFTDNDEAANQVYRDLPQGKTWMYGDREYSSYVELRGGGDDSIAEQKGWEVH